MTEEVERRHAAIDIAILKEQVSTLGRDMVKLEAINKLQNEKLDSVLMRLSEAKGGWRTMMWFGGAAATLGSMLGWAADHFLKVH